LRQESHYHSQPSQNQHRYLGDAVSPPQAKRRATVQQEPEPTAYNSETDIRDGDRVTVDVVAGKVAERPQRESCPHKYKQDRCCHDRGRHTRRIEDTHTAYRTGSTPNLLYHLKGG